MNRRRRSATADFQRPPSPLPWSCEGHSQSHACISCNSPQIQATPCENAPIGNFVLPRKQYPTGGLLVELLVALILLGLMFATGVPTVAWMVRRQQVLSRRQVALVEAANLMDTLTSRGWTDLPPGEVADVQLPPPAVEDLPGVKVAALVEDETDPPARRLTIRIDWRDGPQVPNRPVLLTGWVYP